MKPEQKQEFKESLASLYLRLKEELELKETPKVILVDDPENAKKLLGKTAHYEPKTKTIQLNITDRHPKDILRSFAHEVIHHWQHEHEQLNKGSDENLGPGYAQKDPHMRKMEKQAYLLGKMMFRDWEDGIKTGIKKKDKLNENAETIEVDSGVYSVEEARGPFVLFWLENKPRYAYGDLDTNEIVFDDGDSMPPMSGGKPYHRVETHGPVIWTINYVYPELQLSRDRGNDETVHGRMWLIDGNVYISFWNDRWEEIQPYISILNKLIKDQGKTSDLNRAFVETKNGDFIPYLRFTHQSTKIGPKDKKARELHLMSPIEKSKTLKSMGVEPKVGDTPEWMRKQLAGVDENLELTDRNKSKIDLKNLVVSMIRNGVIKSYNQKLTSGETFPENFVEDFVEKLQVCLEKEINQINMVGDKYIKPGIE